MANCIDKFLCENSSCNVLITDSDNNIIDTRFLHEGDEIFLSYSEISGAEFTNFSFVPFEIPDETEESGEENLDDGGEESGEESLDDGGEEGGEESSDDGDEEGGDIDEFVLQPDGRYLTHARCGGTYVANFQTITYDVTVSSANATMGTAYGTGTYAYGTIIVLSAEAYTNYHFIGWTVLINGVETPLSNETPYEYFVNDTVVIHANFEGDFYSIITKPNNVLLGTTTIEYQSEDVGATGIYQYNDNITIKAIELPGSTFNMWDNGLTNQNENITVYGNAIYTAIFSKNFYSVNVICGVEGPTDFIEDVGGMVTGGGLYEYGSVVELSAIPEAGYSFVSFSENGNVLTNESVISFTVTNNRVIKATFENIVCLLSLNVLPIEGGTIVLNDSSLTPFIQPSTYPYNTQVEVKAINASGYEFVKWIDNDTSETKTFIMTEDRYSTAIFREIIPLYTLTVISGKHGVIAILENNILLYATIVQNNATTTTTVQVEEGKTLLVFARPNEGFEVQGWQDENGNAIPTIDTEGRKINVQMTGDKTVYVSFV